MATHEYTAVVDRFEDDAAVLLLEDDDDVVDQKDVPTADLPPAGRHQDAVVRVTVQDERVVGIEYDAQQTERREAAAQDRFDRLSDRPPSTDSESGEDVGTDRNDETGDDVGSDHDDERGEESG